MGLWPWIKRGDSVQFAKENHEREVGRIIFALWWGPVSFEDLLHLTAVNFETVNQLLDKGVLEMMPRSRLVSLAGFWDRTGGEQGMTREMEITP